MEGSVQTIAFKSTILDTELDLQLYIPPNYHENIAYHIAITGDGQDFFKLGKIDQQMETFILEESALTRSLLAFLTQEFQRAAYGMLRLENKKMTTFAF
ncbi:alpha/beta hydrolase-fold protein [Geomicrobium sp. JCM 19039]|uniref:alpha/beta hydrolase-fold protein n=1 Tax=Geomicrobium sp. JCM 19039 TaxID=1460636 RepID=UPI00045F2270|nr:hypothetical protein [Geomicrobium sp. JCM 19039]GAK11886.1 hypothetical protein JCM19039_1608 [Geomicrobium sp. JCM 19039]